MGHSDSMIADIETPAELYGRAGFMVKRLHQVATALFDEECRQFNMTPSQYQALSALHQYPAIDQIALGRLTGQDRSTVGLVVRLLLDRGLIRRIVNASDKRRASLKLSPAGVRVLRETAPAARQAQNRFLAALPEEDRPEFLSLLKKLVDGHGANIDPASIVAREPAKKTSRLRATAKVSVKKSDV